MNLSRGPAPLAKPHLWIMLAIGTAFILGVAFELSFLNGPWYWKWPWRTLGFLRTAAFYSFPLVPFSYALVKISSAEDPLPVRRILGLLVLSSFGFQGAGALAEPEGIDYIRQIVLSPSATSYYTDATRIGHVRDWLAHYHTATLSLHSSTHPPGPILFYWGCIALAGHAGAALGGCLVGLAASFGVAVVYSFSALWTGEPRSRLLASACYALLPGLVLFFPEFDQIYPIFTMLLVGTWIRALQGERGSSLKFGIVFFLATFFAYNLLALGSFLAFYTVYFLRRPPAGSAPLRRALGSALQGGLTAFLLYAALWLGTGFNPLRSFAHALETQAHLAGTHGRPYFPCALFDLYDFMLGAGVIAFPLLLFYVQEALDSFSWDRTDLVLSLMGLGAVLLIDLTGLLRAETARVWLFLQPFVVLPVALELRRQTPWVQGSFFGIQFLTVIALKEKMGFICP